MGGFLAGSGSYILMDTGTITAESPLIVKVIYCTMTWFGFRGEMVTVIFRRRHDFHSCLPSGACQRPGSWDRPDGERDRQVGRARPPSCAKGVGDLAHGCKPLQIFNLSQNNRARPPLS